MNHPAWSPDGKTIVCVAYQQGDALGGLLAVDAITGKQNRYLSIQRRVSG